MKKNKKKHLNHMSECKTRCPAAMKQKMEMFAPMYRELDILAMSVEPMREYLLEVRQNAESVQTCMQVLISSIDAVLEVVDDCDDEDDVDPFDMEDDDE